MGLQQLGTTEDQGWKQCLEGLMLVETPGVGPPPHWLGLQLTNDIYASKGALGAFLCFSINISDLILFSSFHFPLKLTVNFFGGGKWYHSGTPVKPP